MVTLSIGWFILLTSLLSFWRVKRWERGILAAQPAAAALPIPASAQASTSDNTSANILIARFGMFRSGLGLGAYPGAPRQGEEEEDPLAPPSEYIIPIDPNDPERNSRLARAYADEARLHRDLRAAGLL